MEPLPKSIIEYCQREALGQTLTSWGDFTYVQIVSALRVHNRSVVEHDDFLIWEKYEDEDWGDLADIIEDIFESYKAVALFAYRGGTERNHCSNGHRCVDCVTEEEGN